MITTKTRLSHLTSNVWCVCQKMNWSVFLHLKVLGIVDMGLAVTSWILQMASWALGLVIDGDTTKLGAGFWCGITFFVTGAVAFKMHHGELYGHRLVFGCVQLKDAFLFIPAVSFACSWIQMIIFAVSIHYIKNDPGYQHHIQDSPKLKLNSLLLVCGVVGIFANTLISIAAVKGRNAHEQFRNENDSDTSQSTGRSPEQNSVTTS